MGTNPVKQEAIELLQSVADGKVLAMDAEVRLEELMSDAEESLVKPLDDAFMACAFITESDSPEAQGLLTLKEFQRKVPALQKAIAAA